ncbi:MAG: hypothetical protein JO139_18645 [Alphaproteobacteria bacterium]|nr:hypothetical protein [Alphaproteobacteria bacterium]
MATFDRKTWRVSEVNLVEAAAKHRQAEDQRRADVWQAAREAELEAVLGRTYDGRDIPGVSELIAEAEQVLASYIARFDRLFAEHYPAEFAKATLRLTLTPGGILDPKVREQVRRDATRHLLARKKLMLANIAGVVTEHVADASIRGTDNPEVQEVLARVTKPNETTPRLEPPGPAIGMLAKLLPHPELWGFDGAQGNASLLPAPPQKKAEIAALPAPKKKSA